MKEKKPESDQKRARWRGKNLEYSVAKDVKGEVVGRSKSVKVGDKFIQVNPQQPPDVVNEWASFECKSRKSLPKWFRKGMSQAIHNAPDGFPSYMVVYDREDRAKYVIERFDQWLDWHIGYKEEK